ncbi:uncharacterized protein LOC127245241 [Andrographis paniculata]|uniref:uncharacterized protein LOC127245241 n=1 Tax=Andrographis paniculata TaxID=175694 RepID=UPI0021E73514|nr:uncharacterized protein LOC127245241 [Andrographis paniculata]
MSSVHPIYPPATAMAGGNLFAAIDLGTSSFKLTVVRADPHSGRFLTLNRLKDPVRLGLDITDAAISTESLDRAVSAIRSFQNHLHSHSLPPSHLRLVATSAVREASNKSEFITAIDEHLGLRVDILSGEEEARLIYLGVLQFFPISNSTVLTIDIGGGSTEFTVGFHGNILFSKSLKLGHVTLTQKFSDVALMREHITTELETSGLIPKIKEFKLDAVIGSSGTIRAIDKAVSKGYALKPDENHVLFDEFVKPDWRFSRDELRDLVQSLHDEEEDDNGIHGKLRREQFFKSRAGFIKAGTVLLDVIFDKLGIEEMEVSGYALGEGVITDMLGQVHDGFDLNANARWRSVVRLATRFNNKKRMKAAATCAGIAREFLEGMGRLNTFHGDGSSDNCELSVFLDDADIEYLDAACLLHNIGMYSGKKGYHKQSYRAIMNGDNLGGYTREETKLIALLVRYHRKKIPKDDVLEGSTKVKQKFRILCAILRISCALQQCFPVNSRAIEFVHSSEGLKLILRRTMDETRGRSSGESIDGILEKELDFFKTVFKQKLSIQVT